VARLAAAQHGIISSWQLNACGLDADAIALRVAGGRLHRQFRAVYAVGHAALTPTGCFIAAVLACGDDAVLSDHAGAAHLGLRRWRGCIPEVTVTGARGRKLEGIRVHRRTLDPRDIWIRDGIRVTSPARTILDLAATMSVATLRRMVRQAHAERLVTTRQLLDVLARHRGHRGAAKLRAVIAEGAAPTRSVLEDHVLELIVKAGIERPEINARLVVGGRAVEPDMLWREQRLIVECDGRRWHSDPLTRRHDAARQALLEANGYRVIRITWEQVVDHPQQTIARICAALAASPRGSSGA
jgi:very-short-patch-repair endonuclease